MNECISIINNSVTCRNSENIAKKEYFNSVNGVNSEFSDEAAAEECSNDEEWKKNTMKDFTKDTMKNTTKRTTEYTSDVPISAMLVNKNNGDIVATAQNDSKHSLLHAEMIVLNSLPQKKHLQNYDLFVTLEPCPMCKHAIRLMQVNRVIFGAYRNFFADGFWNDSCKLAHKKLTMYDLYRKNSLISSLKNSYSSIDKEFFHSDALFSPSFRQEYIGGICENECSNLVKKFFKKVRRLSEK